MLVPKPNNGVCKVALEAKINIGNFQNITVNIGFEEAYSGAEGDTYEDRFNSLLDTTNEKLEEALIQSVKKIRKTLHQNTLFLSA